MKRKAWISNAIALVLTSALLPTANALAGATQVGDFALIDHLGVQHQLSRLGNHKAVVVIAQSNSCAENVEQLHRYKHLRTTWKKQGVEILMLNASREDSLDSIRKTAKTYDVDFPIMRDESQLVAESLNISKAGEVLVIEPNSRKLVYRGPLDRASLRNGSNDPRQPSDPEPKTPPSTPLADAMARVVAGNLDSDTVALPPPAKGCDISYPVREAHAKAVPDYAADVTPILKTNCTRCHVDGGIAPFAMSSYEIVRGFAPMIREVLLTKRMPPAQVDPTISHFDNANYISNNELQTLVHWIDAGTPRGNAKAKDPLKSLKPIKEEWQLGPPDLIVEVPAYEVPATGVIDYFNHTIDLPFNEDRYVRAVQFIPGDNRVLHHLLSYITSPDYDRGTIISEENVRDFLEGYAPGKTDATVFPKETGVFIPAGYKLVMQMHYTTMGKVVTDKTRVGLYFHDKAKPPTFKYQTLPVSNGGPNLIIPPGEQSHAMNGQYVFKEETMLYALRPHMHYRGKSFMFRAVYPDGNSEILMNVPDYNFAWQPTYRLSTPKLLPAGTRIMTQGVYDNSKFNRGNPDPNAVVKGGPQSWDEMFIGYVTYTESPNKGNNAETAKEKVSSR